MSVGGDAKSRLEIYMPQYEIKDTESSETIVGDVGDVGVVEDVREVREARVVKVRARSAVEAVRNHLNLAADSSIAIERGTRFEALEGWLDATVDGVTVTRIRMFQRMKFRRA